MKYFISIGSTILFISYLVQFMFAPDNGTLAVMAIHLFIATISWSIIIIEREIK